MIKHYDYINFIMDMCADVAAGAALSHSAERAARPQHIIRIGRFPTAALVRSTRNRRRR